MGENDISIGNVRFNKNDVKSSSVKQDADGDNIYSVFLKNGTQIKFRDQKADSKAQVTIGYDMGNENKYGTAFSGIKGLSIQGSNSDDYYHLRDCDYYIVDVTGGGKDEVRVVNTMGDPKSATVKSDTRDNAYTVDTSHGISMGEGWFIGQMEPRTKVPPEGSTPPPKTAKTIKDNLADLKPIASIVTEQENEVCEYRDADGNTVIRVDYMNDDPEEFFAEEEVRSPEGRLISYTSRTSDGSGANGTVWFDKYVFDENEKFVKIITTKYENGKLVSTKEKEPTPESEANLQAVIYPGIVIPDTEMREFLEARGATMVGNR